jgi:hypothetical protein
MSGTHRLRLGVLAIIGAAATIGYAVMALVAPRSAATGILVAFLFWSGISIGALAAMMIHRLTGGAWGYANARAFELAAGLLPLVALSAVAVFLLVPALYPWTGGSTGTAPDVAHWYLNSPLFVLRTCVAFAGWIAIYLLIRLPGTAGTLAAGFGLVFYGLIVGVVGLDWIQSIEPPFFSSSFGASLAFTQLLAAFAATALLAPQDQHESATFDLGGLMLATVLGLTYIDFMAVLIVWYGNLPHKVEWFLRRDQFPWSAVAWAAFILVSAVPGFALLFTRVRASRTKLRAVALAVLVGIAMYYAWLVAPAGGAASLLAAAFAITGFGGLLIGLGETGFVSAAWRRVGVAHAD